MTKASAKKQYWVVEFGYRWERTSFSFTTAEDAAVFMENAAEHYNKIFTDTTADFQCSMRLVSEEEYTEILRRYKENYCKEESAEKSE